MKTKITTGKKFDAVKYMRQERDRTSKDISDLTSGQRLEYFRKKSLQFRNKRKD